MTTTILASTAFMNQPATRAFRVILVHSMGERTGDEYIVWYQSPNGDKWDGSYWFDLASAFEVFVQLSERHLYQTIACAGRLEAEFKPFVPAASINPMDLNRFRE